MLESARFLPNAKVSVRLQEIRVDLVERADCDLTASKPSSSTAAELVFFQLGVDRVVTAIDSHESGKVIVGVDVGELRGHDKRPSAAFPTPVGLLQGHPRVKDAEQEAAQ